MPYVDKELYCKPRFFLVAKSSSKSSINLTIKLNKEKRKKELPTSPNLPFVQSYLSCGNLRLTYFEETCGLNVHCVMLEFSPDSVGKNIQK